MQSIAYEYKHNSVCRNGIGLGPVHGCNYGQRREFKIAAAKPNRRYQLGDTIRELAWSDHFHQSGFDLPSLSATLAALCPEGILTVVIFH
jgi:hypothetical protein